MQIEQIRTLFAYDRWANARILTTVGQLTPAQLDADIHGGQGGTRATLLHMGNGLRIWRLRWQGDPPIPTPVVDDYPTIAALQGFLEQEQEHVRRFLTSMSDADLTCTITFLRVSEQRTITRSLWQVFVNLINHQTQHRSEIAAYLTSVGHSPGDLGMNNFFDE